MPRRSSRRGGFTRWTRHARGASAHKQWTPERLIHWGTGIGPNTGQFVAQLLQRFKHPEHGYRSCLGLLSQAKHYGPVRLEAACTLALELRAGHYRHVRDILANGRDLVPRSEPAPEWGPTTCAGRRIPLTPLRAPALPTAPTATN